MAAVRAAECPDDAPPRNAALEALVRRTLVASRRLSWRGCIRCDRCGDTCSARGAALQLCNGRAATLSIGGLPVRVAREEGYVQILQRRDCAAAPLGKGIATQVRTVPRELHFSRTTVPWYRPCGELCAHASTSRTNAAPPSWSPALTSSYGEYEKRCG